MNLKSLVRTIIPIILGGLLTLHAAFAHADARQPKPVGTWALSLDAGPFGVPGFALRGIATFHRDGTAIFVDAGDFGSLGTLDSAQLGAWKRTRDGVVARMLMLSSDPATGEPLFWQRVTVELQRGIDGDHMVGVINVEMLACVPTPPLPGALTCPDPVTAGGAFAPSGPANVPIEFHRHTVE